MKTSEFLVCLKFDWLLLLILVFLKIPEYGRLLTELAVRGRNYWWTRYYYYLNSLVSVLIFSSNSLTWAMPRRYLYVLSALTLLFSISFSLGVLFCIFFWVFIRYCGELLRRFWRRLCSFMNIFIPPIGMSTFGLKGVSRHLRLL